MTGEEIVKQLREQNRQALQDAGSVTNENILDLMTQASIRGMKFGSDVALASLKAALAVQKASA